jgi:4-azaleucine resistance transporter AzlC
MLTRGTRAFFDGVFASLSIAAGYLPVAFSFGLAAVQAGLAPFTTVLISCVVFAGASQFLMITLLAAGAGVLTTVPTVLLMNARHLFYGPAIATRMLGQLPSPLLAFGLTDEVFSTAASKLDSIQQEDREIWFLGLQTGAYGAWVLGTVIGAMLIGDFSHWPVSVREALSFVLPGLFFSLLLESDVNRWKLPMLVAGGTAALLLLFLPDYHVLVLAIIAGTVAHVVRSTR